MQREGDADVTMNCVLPQLGSQGAVAGMREDHEVPSEDATRSTSIFSPLSHCLLWSGSFRDRV